MNNILLDGYTYEIFPISTPDFIVGHDVPFPIAPIKMYRESFSALGFYQPALYLYESLRINGKWYGFNCISAFNGKEYFSATAFIEECLENLK